MNMSLSGSSEFPLPNPIRREDRNLAVYSETGFGSATGQRQPDSTIYASDVQTDKAVTGDDVAENGGLHSLLQPSSNLPDPEHDANHEVNVDDAENASANTETGDASPSGVMPETLEPSQPQRQNNCLNEGANGKEPHVPDNSQGQNGKSRHTQGRTSVKKSRSKKFLKGVKHFFSRLFRRERSKKRKLRPLNPDKT